MESIVDGINKKGDLFSMSQLKSLELNLNLGSSMLQILPTVELAVELPEDSMNDVSSKDANMPMNTTTEEVFAFFSRIPSLEPVKFAIQVGSRKKTFDHESDIEGSSSETFNPIASVQSILQDTVDLVVELATLVQNPDMTVITKIRMILNEIAISRRRVIFCGFTGKSDDLIKANIIVRKETMPLVGEGFDEAVQMILELLAEVRENGLIDNEAYDSYVGKLSFDSFQVWFFTSGYEHHWFL